MKHRNRGKQKAFKLLVQDSLFLHLFTMWLKTDPKYILKIQVHQMSPKPKNAKIFGLKKYVYLRNCYFDYSMWMFLFGKGWGCVCEIKIFMFQNSITLCWSAILKIRMGIEEKPRRPIQKYILHKSVSWHFTSSKFSVTGFLCVQFTISIPIKGYSLSEDHIPDLLRATAPC